MSNVIRCGKTIAIIVIALHSVIACNNINVRLNVEQAVLSIKNIRDAQANFKATSNAGRYGTLKELANAGFISPPLADGIDQGYKFEIRLGSDSYEAFAVPLEYSESANSGTGYLSLYVDTSGVIRGGDKRGAEANANDEPFFIREDN